MKVRNLIAVVNVCAASMAYSGAMGPKNLTSRWVGFYLGAHVGGWWSQNSSANMNGSVSFVRSGFPVGSGAVASALATVGTNDISINSNGFIGGGQAGYNYIYINRTLFGVEADIDGLKQPNNSTNVNKVVILDGFPSENYDATVSAAQKINWLGTLRGRLGFLCTPTLLLYGTGGLAYGTGSLDISITANESAGALIYPPVVAQNNTSQTRVGWTAGGGVEWKFYSHWSARAEYIYYNLSSMNKNLILSQTAGFAIPPVLYAAANVTSSALFSVGTARVGLNYHFS